MEGEREKEEGEKKIKKHYDVGTRELESHYFTSGPISHTYFGRGKPKEEDKALV